MRRSLMLGLAIATSSVARAEPPRAKPAPVTKRTDRTMPLAWVDTMPRNFAPELSPPGLTPTIREFDCSTDSFEELRSDCSRDAREDWMGNWVQERAWEARDPDHGRLFRSLEPTGHSTSSDWRPAPMPRP